MESVKDLDSIGRGKGSEWGGGGGGVGQSENLGTYFLARWGRGCPESTSGT